MKKLIFQHFSSGYPLLWMLVVTGGMMTSCMNEVTNPDNPVLNKTISEEYLSEKEQGILVNVLSSKFGEYKKGKTATRSQCEFNISPYVESGDTLMYVVQFLEGWELYSANPNVNSPLFTSDKGVFRTANPNMPPALKETIHAQSIKFNKLKDGDLAPKDCIGIPIAISNEEAFKGTVMINTGNGVNTTTFPTDVPPGKWIVLETERLNDEIIISPKLITTKWGQLSPWNKYAKWVIDPETNKLIQTPAGCAPVALSQYFYFTHFKDGVPATSVTSASPTSDGLDYVFSGENSIVWDQMSKYYFQYKTNESALLIGKTGRELESKYEIGNTWTYDYKNLALLKKVYGKDFVISDFAYNDVKNSIDNGYPIIAKAISTIKTDGTNINPVGHTFIIDQYKQVEYKYRTIYALERYPMAPSEESKWESDLIGPDGNVIRYAYTCEIYTSTPSHYISANWGSSGESDEVFYLSTGNWQVGNYIFNQGHQIYKPQ